MSAPYPLLFRPILLEKVWGGRRLSRYGKALPDGRLIGESWELADLESTSPSGAGGGAARSVIANGELEGRTIGAAMELWGAALLGAAAPASAAGGFPLLVKFLDARENLSVQVHPSAAYAAAHPGCGVKSECWYILEAEPGAVLYKGVREGVTRERFEACVRDGTVAECLEAVPAIAGECHTLPSGSCHALGAGVLAVEVQTPSDTTFRLYDWGRTERELHVEQAMACVDLGPAPAATRRAPEGQSWEELARTDLFTIHHARISEEEQTVRMGRRLTPEVLVVVAGRATLEAFGQRIELSAGATVLVPVAVMRYTLTPEPGGTVEYLNISLR